MESFANSQNNLIFILVDEEYEDEYSIHSLRWWWFIKDEIERYRNRWATTFNLSLS